MTARPAVLRRGTAILWRACQEEPRIFTWSLLGSLGYGLMIIAQAYVLGYATDHVVVPAINNGHADRSALAIALLLIAGVAAVKVAGIMGRRIAAGIMQYRLQGSYRQRIARRYLDLPMSWHARHPTGALLSNANSDVEALWYPIAPFPFAVGVFAIMLVTLGLLVATDLGLALLGALVFPAVIVTNALYARAMSQRVTRAQALRADVSGIAHESFEGALVVKTLGREDAETERFAARSYVLRDALVGVGRLRGLFDPLLEAIPNVGTLLVLLVGASRVDAGTLVRVAYLFGLLAFPLRAIGWMLAELPRSVVGDDRVQQVLTATGDLPYGDVPAPPGAGPLALQLDCVDFGYDGAAPVLTGITAGIEPGRVVAIVGPTGAGKSTLASLLVRLMDPDTGVIRYGGVDLRAFAPGAVASAAALVAQQTFLFDDTVRGNVTLGAPFDDEQVWDALRGAQADGFVAALPDGLDAMIGERGTTLSGGQRQRLSLARALVRRPRLLILDDATSAVDPAVEQAILAGLRRAAGTQLDTQPTTVLIAHRRATIALADEVLFLDGGRVADRGSHAELQERNPAYAAIVSAYDTEGETAGSELLG
ncbi:MAG TPA: ABC transporter ATP-binding protein [Mycobacteriales bacterium]|nr:ABC transporter ATP-binding protein [Mycobacteriales bacterium]